MLWKTLVLSVLAVGALADVQITEEQKQQYTAMLNQYCKKNGAEDKVGEVQTAMSNFVTCAKNLFDMATIQREVEEAKPQGALDEVFKKYCAKTPELKACLNDLLAGISPCMDNTIREHIPEVKNGTNSLIDFICYKDGDRIALFYAEGGPECFQQKANNLRECAQKLRETVPTVEAAKALDITSQCTKYDELTTCTVKALEECSTPTPANMAESLFRYIKKASPCNKA